MGNDVFYSLGEEVLEHYIDKSDNYFNELNYYINQEDYMINICEELASLCILSYRLSQWNKKREKQYIMYSIKYIELLIGYLDSCKEYKVQQYGYTALGYCLDLLADTKESFKGFNVAVNEAVIRLVEILLDKKNSDLSDEEIIQIVILSGYLNSRDDYERAKQIANKSFRKLGVIYERRHYKLRSNTLLYIVHALLVNANENLTKLMRYYMIMDFKEICNTPLNHEETIMKINIESELFGMGEKNIAKSCNSENVKHKNDILSKWMDFQITYNEMLIFITEKLDKEKVLYKLRGVA